MGEIVDLGAKIKRYFKFSPLEIRHFIIIVVVFAFIISIREWGPGDQFEFLTGLFNFLRAIIIIAISLFVYHSAQKIAGLHVGYRVEYQLWSLGLLFGLILVFVTTSFNATFWFWFLVPGGILVHHLAKHRIGFYRYGLGYFAVGMIAFAGPVASIIFYLCCVVKRSLWVYFKFITY